MSINEVQANGWTAVPVDGKKIIDQLGGVKETAAIKLEEIHFPSDVPLVK